jgi:SAM-dependent methyltransferase
MQMMLGGFTTKVLAEVTRLGVPDALERYGPSTAAELVERGIRANPLALHRALRAWAALGLASEDAEGRFGPTPLSALLTANAPGSLKRLAQFTGGMLWKVWTGLPEALATGDPQARSQFGMDFFEYVSAQPGAMEEFGGAMKANSFNVVEGLLANYDFSGVRKLVDVGGGFGHLVIAALERYPLLRGVLFEMADVIAAAPKQLPVEDHNVRARLEYVAGDMFADVPAADAYVLKMIIHDWDDEHCIRILRNCARRLEPGGRVLCIDAVLPPLGDVSDAPGKLIDVNMMLVMRGKERTRAEWDALYREAGLAVTAVMPIPDTLGTCIVEGRDAGERPD